MNVKDESVDMVNVLKILNTSCLAKGPTCIWVKVFRINFEFRIFEADFP